MLFTTDSVSHLGRDRSRRITNKVLNAFNKRSRRFDAALAKSTDPSESASDRAWFEREAETMLDEMKILNQTMAALKGD